MENHMVWMVISQAAMIRLSVGVDHPADLIADRAQAREAAWGMRAADAQRHRDVTLRRRSGLGEVERPAPWRRDTEHRSKC
jgi:hypothetical protein